ncbi:predicted protein [Naegleria gruberi]|uniref:Predicted protein n=1 Tax=Naegleria gruberi TaxID=5762 RepID=D2VDY9_NAEGR|nr:uncharacterized protein NAEGRDRAFT_67091 [Naegleria gruberi]EFC44982.1 predicted protein [Naegleria gruberi]|eukprot:XP_002677726.1 predicted protein [Naegleria gruberi strain NEG-M]
MISRNGSDQQKISKSLNSIEHDDADEEYYNDIIELSPSEFISKYIDDSIYFNDDAVDDFNSMGIEEPKRKANFHDVSTDVLCYIILTYLDWKTVFSSCLSVSKEFFRRIANNRLLFINLFNELFVMKQEEIDSLTFNSTFKHKNCHVEDIAQYAGFGIPNEHYHFCRDYDYEWPNQSEFNEMHKLLKKHYVNNSRMTDAKLRLIRERWNNAISVYKKSKNMKRTTSKKEENQALLNLIKRIIKDRLFMRKFFNKDLKSVKICHLHYSHFVKHERLGYEEARNRSANQLPLKDQVEHLVNGEGPYEMFELEEIVIGNLNSVYNPTDEFIRCFKNYSYADSEGIVSFLASKFY